TGSSAKSCGNSRKSSLPLKAAPHATGAGVSKRIGLSSDLSRVNFFLDRIGQKNFFSAVCFSKFALGYSSAF
ncbi:hypothetical protein CH379_013145, partial [Leptospira ellisii]